MICVCVSPWHLWSERWSWASRPPRSLSRDHRAGRGRLEELLHLSQPWLCDQMTSCSQKEWQRSEEVLFSPCIITVVLLSVHQNSRGSYSLPGSSFADEDQGTHDDAGQGDAHTGNDPGHRLLVYVVETIWKHWRIGGRKKRVFDRKAWK